MSQKKAGTAMREDLTGKRFGQLTVLSGERRSGSSRHYWRCRCDCGGETLVEASHLKNGHTKSCGCYRKMLPQRRSLDLQGHRYGRLTVLEAYRTPESSDGEYWRCRCDCGNTVVCHKESLRSGNTRSCGCLREEMRKENMRKGIHFEAGTCIERIASQKLCANNTSGRRGVYQRENRRWRAAIGFQGKVYNLGTFDRFEDAVSARVQAEQELYQTFLKTYREQTAESNITVYPPKER